MEAIEKSAQEGNLMLLPGETVSAFVRLLSNWNGLGYPFLPPHLIKRDRLWNYFLAKQTHFKTVALNSQAESCALDLGATSKTVGSSMAQLLTAAAQVRCPFHVKMNANAIVSLNIFAVNVVACGMLGLSLARGMLGLSSYIPTNDVHQKLTQYEERGFHSLLTWKMIVLPNSHCITYTFLYKRLGECTFQTWEWKG